MAGKPGGRTPASTARRSARSPRCLPKRSRRCGALPIEPFATTTTASAPSTSMAVSKSRPRPTARRPGWLGQRVQVQWNERARPLARAQDRRSCCASISGHHVAGIAFTGRIDRPARRQAPWRCWPAAKTAGPRVGAVCDVIHQHDGGLGRPVASWACSPSPRSTARPSSTTPPKRPWSWACPRTDFSGGISNAGCRRR